MKFQGKEELGRGLQEKPNAVVEGVTRSVKRWQEEVGLILGSRAAVALEDRKGWELRGADL